MYNRHTAEHWLLSYLLCFNESFAEPCASALMAKDILHVVISVSSVFICANQINGKNTFHDATVNENYSDPKMTMIPE